MKNSRLESDSFSGPLNEVRAASAAGGGSALTTAASIVGFPRNTSHVGLIARNFTTAVVVKFALNPFLYVLRSDDALASATAYSLAAQTNPATTGVTLSALATLANGGVLAIGSHLPFRGIAVTMLGGSVNANASVLTIEYWNGTQWTAVSGKSDGTAAAGATFAQTGNITFTVPTDWAQIQLSQTLIPAPANPPVTPTEVVTLLPDNRKPRYWVRLTVSAALSATVVANTMFSLNRSTAYAEMIENSLTQFRTTDRSESTACVEALTDAGTANMIVNCYTDNPLGVFQ